MIVATWYDRASTWLTGTCPGRIVVTVMVIDVVSAGGFVVDHFGTDRTFVGVG